MSFQNKHERQNQTHFLKKRKKTNKQKKYKKKLTKNSLPRSKILNSEDVTSTKAYKRGPTYYNDFIMS